MVADVANAKDGDWGERDDRYVDRHGTLYHLYGVIEFPQWAAVIEGVHHIVWRWESRRSRKVKQRYYARNSGNLSLHSARLSYANPT